MDKSTFSKNYTVFLTLLREARQNAGLTQEQLADRIGKTQSFVSKCERGERRIDAVELATFCVAIGVKFSDFAASLENILKSQEEPDIHLGNYWRTSVC